uniref:Voltage-dependent calcium channel gamma-1 subunit n=1 Tax=Ursus maritimus TaxID=29073 RepID=A0A452UYS3_URSMA
MSQTKAPKVRVTLFCILVGVVLALVAVVTDHWAVLSPELDHHNATCEAAHFGLWRICTKRIVMTDSKDKTCGPITLPGEKNCSYFRHFNPGETSEIFHVTTQKGEPVGESHSPGWPAVLRVHQGLREPVTRSFLAGPATAEGILFFPSPREARVMGNPPQTPYNYSWSFACACAAFVLLFLGGLALLLFSLPRMPQNPWESCMDAEPEH